MDPNMGGGGGGGQPGSWPPQQPFYQYPPHSQPYSPQIPVTHGYYPGYIPAGSPIVAIPHPAQQWQHHYAQPYPQVQPQQPLHQPILQQHPNYNSYQRPQQHHNEQLVHLQHQSPLQQRRSPAQVQQHMQQRASAQLHPSIQQQSPVQLQPPIQRQSPLQQHSPVQQQTPVQQQPPVKQQQARLLQQTPPQLAAQLSLPPNGQPETVNLLQLELQHRPPPPSSATIAPSQIQQSSNSRFLSHVQIPAKTQSPSHSLPPTHSPNLSKKTSSSKTYQAEYRFVLLALAEQSLTEARDLRVRHSDSVSSKVTRERYCKLIALSVDCYETLLLKKHWQLSPRLEASIFLRYASLLFEETENVKEVEKLLTRGLLLCEQNHLLNLKYSMQHILVQVIRTQNFRAATTYLDKIINDISASQHIQWTYLFGFLRVQFSLQANTQHELIAAINQLSTLRGISKHRGDNAITAVTALLEVVAHLQSRTPERMSDAQLSVASARAAISNLSLKDNPQLAILLHMLDLLTSLEPFVPEHAKEKMQRMQQLFDEGLEGCDWSSSTFVLPLTSHHERDFLIPEETHGLFAQTSSGSGYGINFQWISLSDAYVLGFLLSAFAIHQRNYLNGKKTEIMLDEGLKLLKGTENGSLSSISTPTSRNLAQIHNWRQTLRYTMLLHLAFARCGRSAWDEALDCLDQLQMYAKTRPNIFDASMGRICRYLVAMIEQGRGNLDRALAIYQSPDFQLPEQRSLPIESNEQLLSILATMNTLMIIRPSTHPLHHLNDQLLGRLALHLPVSSNPSGDLDLSDEPRININSTNAALNAAHHVLLAISPPSSEPGRPSSTAQQGNHSISITNTKAHLQASLVLAARAQNKLLQALCLAHMHRCFFTGIVGTQSEKAARGARSVANEAGSQLWTCVGDIVLSQVFERAGNAEEATTWLNRSIWCARGLPERVKAGCGIQLPPQISSPPPDVANTSAGASENAF